VSNITLIIDTVALWVIIVCQILESKQFIRSRKDMGELIKKNAELGKKNAELGLAFNDLDLRIKNLEERLSDSAITEVQQKQAEIKFELTRIDKTASNNREKIVALQERNKDQQKYNADFAKAIRRVGKK
jgi:hypothetical protein